MDKFTIVITLIVTFLFIFIAPLFTIWSLNLIFGLTIPVNFYTWLSVLWLHGVVAGTNGKVISKVNNK